MKKRSFIPASLTALLAVLFLFFGCSDVEYDHVLDPQSSNYLGNDQDFKQHIDTTHPGIAFDQISLDSINTLYDEYDVHRQTLADTVPPTIILYEEINDQIVIDEDSTVTINVNDVTMLNKLENTLFEARSGQNIDITANVRVDATDVNILQPDTYTISYTVETARHTTTRTRTVIVIAIDEDTEPIIQLEGGNTVYFYQGNYEDPGATAYDPNQDYLDISDRITTSDHPQTIDNTTPPGTYTRTYSVTNDAGLSATRERTFIVQEPETSGDDVPPTITLLGANPMTIEQGYQYEEPGYEATDDVDGDITGRVHVNNPVDINVPGEYTIEYTVSDNAGNPAAEYRTVIVNETDDPPPEGFIQLNGDATIYWPRGTPYEEVDPPYIIPAPFVNIIDDPASPNAVSVSRSGWPIDVTYPVGSEHRITYTAVHINSSTTEVVTRTVILQ